MSEAKFTKGPWYCANFSARTAQTGKFICHADNNSVDDDERKANAHLIATAPEMYEMLESIAVSMECFHGVDTDSIFKLLAKARGEQ